YLMLTQQQLENEIAASSLTNKSKIVVAPYASGGPISPIPKMVYLLAVVAGIALPLAVFALRELFNNKLGNEGDITTLTDIPVLGSISNNTSGKDIVVGESIRTGIAEQFRLVRANLDFMSSGVE